MSGSSVRRAAVVAPINSYASVASGQSRLPTLPTSDMHHNLSGSNRYNSATNTFGPKQSQSMTNLLPLPAYLRHTAYGERLSQHTKVQQAKTPSYNSISTPPSSLTLPGRVPPTHRSTTFEPIETLPAEDDSILSLPSRWDEQKKFQGIELPDALEAKFIGPQRPSDNEAAAVRADHYMPPQCGIYYYECKILSKSKESLIGIGFVSEKVVMNRLPGWEPESWGYHGDDGNVFSSHGPGKKYGPVFAADDVIGCGVSFYNNTAFFTKNGQYLGIAFRDLKPVKLYPAVGMKRHLEHVRVNFGQEEFIFDIKSHMKEVKKGIYQEINKISPSTLRPPLDESTLIQALVSSYLAHDGYVHAARAFAEDVQREAGALESSGRRGSIRSLEIKEDQDAINRQSIRKAILEGDVDSAIKLTDKFYPSVFRDNEMTHFRLKCRKLVEMIRVVSEASTHSSTNNNSTSKLHHQQPHQDEHMEDVFGRDIDMDDHSSGGGEWERMEVEEEENGIAQVKEPLDAAVQYAQKLRSDFQADKRPEIRKALEESFSLVAYLDPKKSILSHLFDEDGRIAVAEELNSAILVSLGKSSVAPLERLVQQTTALTQELSETGGLAAFVNLHSDILKPCTF